MGGIVILARCEFNFIIVHENLEKHPSNNISINVFSLTLYLTSMTASLESDLN